jgi:hypothetical protein
MIISSGEGPFKYIGRIPIYLTVGRNVYKMSKPSDEPSKGRNRQKIQGLQKPFPLRGEEKGGGVRVTR